MRVGLDIGSTTIKCVVLDENDTLLYSTYERHYSHILEKAQELLRRIDAEQLHGRKALLSISGSAGMGLADSCGVPFVQEVFSTRVAVKKFVPATDCVIELGGEDAKILFLTNGTEVRMNGSCAGGTGAFIDQMATLLKMSADEMNKAAEQAQRTYTIASRCGVFAKSDVQPLINQGARTEDSFAELANELSADTGSNTKGGLYTDGQFLNNVAGCEKYGVPMGVYFYCYDTSPAAAAITAQQVVKMLSGHKFAYPIYYDVEYEKYNLNCGKAQNTAIIKAALETLEAGGYYAAVYCSRDFFINHTLSLIHI